MSMTIARKLLITGKVQGVGYRFFAQRSAARHQVRGYIKNLEDGSVEALVIGEQDQVDGFKDDLLAGPAYAKVDMMEEFVVEPDAHFLTFRIER